MTTQAPIARWVQAQPNYSQNEKSKFLSKADPWLIAEAIINGYDIITFEEAVPDNSSKVKIPNVAANFGVDCTTLYNVLESSQATLVLL